MNHLKMVIFFFKKIIYTNVVGFGYVTFNIHCKNMRLFVNNRHTVDLNILKMFFLNIKEYRKKTKKKTKHLPDYVSSRTIKF